jgi:7,8-dihydroneopterin aldolase/epimerase/oxygenase
MTVRRAVPTRSASPSAAIAATSAEKHSRDSIFVRDWVIDCNIGVYAEEKGVTQKVRLTVDAYLAPGIKSTVDEMVEVPSYTDIIDAIGEITSRGHINLVETFAEEIAAMMLRDQRIGGILVRVEKLERGPVRGVEIYRTRDANGP